MASHRERILQAVVAALSAPSVTIRGAVYAKPGGLRVDRNRRRPAHEDQLPATVVFTVREATDLETHAGSFSDDAELASHVLRVGLEHRAIGEPDDQVLDPLVTWGTRALLADTTLGGLALGVEEVGIEWDGADQDHAYGSASQHFDIAYETPDDDPEG